MSIEVIAAPSSSPTKEQTETVTKMDTSTTEVEPMNTDEAPMNENEVEEVSSGETKASKRKRSIKKPAEVDENSISNTRPRRTLPKREEVVTPVVNGTSKSNKTKAQRNSAEQAATDADDEQERDKNIPILHDVADVVWVKMGGHPWWPSLIVRDPNDQTQCFTKITGNARPKRMYFVVFYGSTADFAWVPDCAVISYQGVEAFTKYAQETVDKAQTKSQKEQLTERFQLKVTIGRREDWELAVRDADQALKQTSETRLEEIDPKVQFYTSKTGPSKGQSGRKTKGSMAKVDESHGPPSVPSSADASDRSLLAEKAFGFKSEDDTSDNNDDDNDDDDDDDDDDDATPVRKTPSVKIKLKKQASNDSTSTPPPKRRYVRKSTNENKTNGSGTSHGQQTPTRTNESSLIDGNSSGKKRGRPRISKPSVITSNGENLMSDSPATTPKASIQKKSITKPQAFMNNKSHPVSSLNNILIGQHHRFDTRIGFLSPFEEQEVFDVVDQLRSTKTFEEAEQLARRRFEQILCLNLNKTNVDVPQEWFYSFLFAHPILIVKNPQWFNDKKFDSLDNNDISNQSSNSIQVLKRQLNILSKLYRNELQVRPVGDQ